MPYTSSVDILLVEDDPVTATLEKRQLEVYGYQVTHVKSGEKAITILEENDFDLILMDIDLGSGIDGTETARKILQREDIPVVFLSSHTEPEVVEKTEKITSYGYVVKHSGITVLDASIKMALKLFHAKKAEEISTRSLEKSEKKYRNLFEHMSEEVHLWKLVRDKNGNIKTWKLVDANPAALKSWGRTRKESIGKTTEEIWPTANPVEQFLPIVEKIFAEGKPYRWKEHFKGTDQTLLMTTVPFGEYFLSTGINIDELKDL